MKIFNLIYQLVILICLFIIFLYWFSAYNSAFEADRACHDQLSSYITKSKEYGCDNDVETHQWILFENLEGSKAKIIERFRYRFL